MLQRQCCRGLRIPPHPPPCSITPELRKELAAVEERVRNRMPLNAKVSKRALVDELVRNNLSEWAVMRALVGMEQRNEIKQLNEGRSILRVS